VRPTVVMVRERRVRAGRRPDVAAWLVVLIAGGLAAGCEPATAVKPGDIRSYAAPKPAATPVTRSAAAATVAPDRSAPPNLKYEVPPGWTDRGASGMRLATLTIGEPAAGREVTVIPASGTLRSNVERWQKQLTAEAEPAAVAQAVDRALAAADTVDIAGTRATVVMLSDQLEADPAKAGDATQAILGAMIPLEDSVALFVKYKGEADVARQEKDRFLQFVSSLRWK